MCSVRTQCVLASVRVSSSSSTHETSIVPTREKTIVFRKELARHETSGRRLLCEHLKCVSQQHIRQKCIPFDTACVRSTEQIQPLHSSHMPSTHVAKRVNRVSVNRRPVHIVTAQLFMHKCIAFTHSVPDSANAVTHFQPNHITQLLRAALLSTTKIRNSITKPTRHFICHRL